jgi:hypothetical protein
LGKSVAYSSLEVATSLSPNTAELVRGARSGVDAMRDFIRLNQTKIRTTTTQYDRTVISKKAKSFLTDAWNDIKQGNLALGDLSEESYDDWQAFLDGSSESSTISYSDQQPSDEPKSDRAAGLNASAVNFTSTDYRTLAGLQQMSSVLGKTQIKTAEYQTAQITNAIFMQMANQNEHFAKIENQLGAINSNLVELVKFQSQSQSATNQAHLQFYDQMTRWMKKQEERQARRERRTLSSTQNKNAKFLGEDWFDMSSYKEMVKDNIDASALGQIMALTGMMDPTMIKMALGGGGKIQPQKFALEWLMKRALTKGGRRSIARGDSQINTITKSLLTELGSYQYKMNSGSTKDTILGLIGGILGIDPNTHRTLRFNQYKHGEMSWNGDAQKALVTVIPKELAEIKAAITHQEARYYDAGTGRFQNASEIKRRVKNRFQDSIEQPFANIFNKQFSTNPDDVRDAKLWAQLDKDTQDKVNEIVNNAVLNTEGMTKAMRTQLDSVMRKAITTINETSGIDGETKKTAVDTQRMVMELQKAVNIARANSASMLEQMQATDSAFTQYGMDFADEYGKMTLDKLRELIESEAIDLRESNGGAYTQSGKRRDRQTEEERMKTENAEGFARGVFDWLNNAPDKRVKGAKANIHRAANRAYRFYQGGNNRYSKGVSSVIDKFFGTIYENTMIDRPGAAPAVLALPPHVETTQGPTTGPSGGGGNGDGGDNTPETPSNGGIVNGDFSGALNKNQTPEKRTADNVQEMNETTKQAWDPKTGFMAKVFNSPVIKKALDWISKTKFGQGVKEKAGKVGDWFKDVFFGDDNSVKTNFQSMGSKVMEYFGIDPKSGKATKGEIDGQMSLFDATQNLSETLTANAEALGGDKDTQKDPEKTKKNILQQLNAFLRKKAPKILTGGVIGAGVGMAAGGHLGLLGSMFLPGGPVGGAIAGMAVSILTESEGFQSMLFGKKNEAGEREGGLISKSTRDSFKKLIPTLGLGAAGGVMLKALSTATGFSGTGMAKAIGFLPSMVLPGGVLGAAIVGAAGAFALRNEKVQDILFGKKNDDGSRTGTLLSNAYNKLTGKIKAGQAQGGGKKKGSFVGKILNTLKGSAFGAIGAAGLSQMGLLGSAFSFGGPIGAAIAGAAVGIAGASDKFNDYLYGTKDDKGKRTKDGLFSRIGTMLKLNFIEPASIWFQSTAEEFMWWAKEKIEIPFRLAFGPVIDAFQNLGGAMADTAKGAIEKVGEKVQNTIEGILKPIGNVFMKWILRPLGKAAGGLLKGGLFAGASIVGAPLQLLATLLKPTRKKGQKLFNSFLRDNKEANLQDYWEKKEAAGEDTNKLLDRFQYNLASLPVIGQFFQSSDLAADMADIYNETTEGKRNAIDWLGARRDKKNYKKNRKAARAAGKEERKLSNLRRRWAKTDNNVSDKVLSDKEFKARTKELKKHGIDINTQEDLRQFTYHYDEWKNRRENPEGAEAPKTAEGQAIISIRDLCQTAVAHLQNLVGLNKAQLDAQTGDVFDTDELGANDDVADKIDSEKAKKVQESNAKAAAEAQAEVNARIGKDNEKKEEHKKVTGNTSGNAHDEDEKEDDKSDKESDIENAEDEVDDADSFTSILKTAGVVTAGVAALGMVLQNDEIRSAVGQLISDGFTLAKDAIGGVLAECLGNDGTGGVNNSRALETDEEGNATKTVSNTDLKSALVKGGLVAARKSTSTVAKKALSASASYAAQAAAIATKSGKVASAAAEGAAAVAASATGKTSIITKALTAIKGALNTMIGSKLGTTTAGKVIGKIGTFIDDLCKGIATKANNLVQGMLEKLSAACGVAGITTASLATPLAVINAVVAAASAIDGLLYPEKIFKIDKKYVDGKMRTIAAIWQGIAAFTGWGAVIQILSEIVTEVMGIDFIQSIACIIYKVLADDDDDAKLDTALSAMSKEVENYNAANGTSLSVDAYNNLKNSRSSLWNRFKNLFGKGDTTDYSQYEVSVGDTTTGNTAGYGTGAVGYGAGMQNDPRWANMPIGKFPNGKTSTMGTGGCGPTALANAAQAMGLGFSPASVGQFAAGNGYITQGGASEALFDQGASQLGMTTSKVGTSADIVSSLKNGNPVILAGKSQGYGPTPYTKAGHIVTLTGMDSAGNAIVEDPMRGTSKYKVSDLQKNMTNGWSVGRKDAAGYGLIDSIFGSAFSSIASAVTSGISNMLGLSDESTSADASDEYSSSAGSTYTTEERAQQQKTIWRYLRSLGFTKEGAAGMMGCWQAESANKPDCIEGYYLKSFPGYQVVNSSSALDDYTTNVLFPAYERSNISINKDAYKGSDGHYYPGFGLAQWTGPRGYSLFQYAKKNGLNWTDLTTQLKYASTEIEDSNIVSKVNAGEDSVDATTKLALDNYEMFSGYANKYPDEYNKRKLAARDYYNRFANDATLDNSVDAVRADGTIAYTSGGTVSGGVSRSDAISAGIKSKYPGAAVSSTTQTKYIADGKTLKVYSGPNANSTVKENLKSGSAIKIYATYKGSDGNTWAAIDSTATKWVLYRSGTTSRRNNAITDKAPSTGNGIGYGIMDNLGNAFTTGLSSLYSSLGLTYNSTSSADDTTADTESSGSSYSASTTVSPNQTGVVDMMASKLGKLRYSTTEVQDPDQGVASCASTVGWAYKKALGVNNMSASSTSQAQDSRFETIWTNNGSNTLDTSILQPGDILYQNWDRTSNNNTMKHTEMYAGDNQDLSHGGTPPMGPTYKDLNDYRKKHTMKVRRYKGFMNSSSVGNGEGAVGFGDGMCVSSTGQRSHDTTMPTYYGDGTEVATITSNRGVETRLDTIIGMMRTIVNNATKTAPATTSVNVNYGEGDTTKVQPTVVVNQTQTRRLGEKDAASQYLRTQHRKVASAQHA